MAGRVDVAGTMADRLADGRGATFVGRAAELSRFAELLASHQPAVVFLHGPAGIGKSTLAVRLAGQAAAAGASAVLIDARDLPPTLEALEFRLAPVLAGPPRSGRPVVILDGYELLDVVDSSLREELAPRLPDDTILVIAGQQPPGVGWRTDPGWAPYLHSWRLAGLARAECSHFLQAKLVPEEQHQHAITFSHGHPLALALVTEVIRQKGTLSDTDSSDVIKTLMDRLLDSFPSPAHRAAIEAAATVRSLNESLLSVLLDQPDVYDLFGWLRSLPYLQDGVTGVFVHDLVRDVVASDLRWRHPERYTSLHDRARRHYLDRLDSADPVVQAVALIDLIYLHPDLRAFLQASEASAALRVEAATEADGPAIAAMVASHEGPESAALARHWLGTRLADWSVVRGPDRQVEGALCLMPLEALDPSADGDPAVVAARTELRTRPPLRPGETATLFRFWLARQTYQDVSPVQSILATQFARHFLTTHALAVTIIPFAVPADWEAFCAYADQRRAPAADFTVGATTYTCFAHDWRLAPPSAWLAQLSQQEIGGPAAPPAGEPAEARMLVLDQGQFTAAVRQALRDYTRPDRLRGSELLRCRFISTRPGGHDPNTAVELLRSELKSAAESLAAVPADQRLHRVLVRAYLSPAPSLERAAEVLDLPSSTFRRLLGTAVRRVATLLWHRELDA